MKNPKARAKKFTYIFIFFVFIKKYFDNICGVYVLLNMFLIYWRV